MTSRHASAANAANDHDERRAGSAVARRPAAASGRRAGRNGVSGRSGGGDLLDRDGLLDSGVLAEYLDVPIGTLDQWASRGGGPPYHKVGKFRRYHPSDVRNWLAGQRRVVDSLSAT